MDVLVKIEIEGQLIVGIFVDFDAHDLVDLRGVSYHEVADVLINVDELGRVLYAILWNGHRALDYSILGVMPLVFVVAHEERAVRVEMHTADVEAQLLLGFEEYAELVQYFLEAWPRLRCGPQIQVLGVSPVIDDHFQFLLVHTQRIGVLDDVFFEEPEEFPVAEICEFDVNPVIFAILSHLFPQLRLSFEFCLGVRVV